MEPLPAFRLLRPASVAEAVAARAAAPTARFLAGGTDLLANLRHGLLAADTLIDLSGLRELRTIESGAAGLRIGAGVTLEQLAAHPALAPEHGALREAALAVAGPTHRASGTVGGNLCLDTRCRFYNQSASWRSANQHCMKAEGEACRVAPKSDRCYAAYSGDLAPALLVLEAVAELAGPGGRRELPLAGLYADDGRAHLGLAAGELVVAVRVPAQPGWRSGYRKLRIRGAIDFPLAGVAVALRPCGDEVQGLRIAVTGTDSQPMRMRDLDGSWRNQAEDEERLAGGLRRQIGPMETTLTSASYRRRVVPVLARRLLRELAGWTPAAVAA